MKQYFNSSETLELCDVRVSENGKVEIMTKNYHREQMERLGRPAKTIRGRAKVENGNILFEPYEEGTRKPTFVKKVVVGSTTVAVTADKVKLSLMLTRNYTKEQLLTLIDAEIQEVLRRLREDLYEELIAA